MDTGYKSKKEEAQSGEPTDNTDTKKKKKKKNEVKQGGVEVLVERLSSGEVQVRARRCNIDEDTMIKEMSEEAIVSELKAALGIWKRETK